MTMGEWGTEAYMWNIFDDQTEEELQEAADYALRVNKESPKSPYYGFRFDGSEYLNQITAMDNLYDQYAVPLMCGSVDIDSLWRPSTRLCMMPACSRSWTPSRSSWMLGWPSRANVPN